MDDGRDCLGAAPSVMYVQFLLLLRSLRACSLGVVLAKVAKNLYMYVEADRKTPPPCFLVKCSFWIWQLEGGRKVLPSVLLTPSPRIDKEGAVC